ncbi:hypothetical protein AFLA70_811g000081, partial [Aspergillus flavus AF70]
MIFGIYSDTISSLRSLRGPNGQMQNMPSHPDKERPSEVSTVKGKQQPEYEQSAGRISIQEGQEHVRQYLSKDQEKCENNMEDLDNNYDEEEEQKDKEEYWDQKEEKDDKEEYWDQ